MESKIEKELLISIEELLIWFKRYERYVEGDTIDAVEWRGEFLEFVMYLVNNLEEQINSQAQPEVLPVEGDEFEYNGEKYKRGKTYTSKDTPEKMTEDRIEKARKRRKEYLSSMEWKVGLGKLRAPFRNTVRSGESIFNDDKLIGFIEQLLDEREREVRKSVLKEVREWLFSYLDKLSSKE